MTTDTPPNSFEDRLMEQLRQVVAQNPAPADAVAPEGHGSRGRRLVLHLTGRRRRRVARGLAFAAVPVALAVAALVVVTSLSSSRSGIAQAAVLTRAAAALDQPNTILYIQQQNYGTIGSCFGLAPSSSAGAPGTPICVGGRSTDAGTSGISADPANDTLNYSSQEWLSPNQSQVHTIYSNGDETVRNNNTGQDTIYDVVNDTLISQSGVPFTPPPIGTIGPLAMGPLVLSREISDPSYFEELYREAQAGDQNTQGQTTFTSQLVGLTTVDGESVYELRFDFHFAASADTPADTAPDQENLLYLDSKTYLPVRSVKMTVNTSGQPDAPSGTTVLAVTDFSVQSLPDTPANESLLQMSPHPGATQIQNT